MAFGATLLAGGLLTTGAAAGYALIGGAVGVVLGLLYLLSPAWRLVVTVDGEALQVTRGSQLRLRLPWDEVVQVVASPDTRTCFIDGGTPARSFLVPGPGASASYDIEDRDVLYAMIVEHVAPARIEWVDLVENARKARATGMYMVPPVEPSASDDPAGAALGLAPAPGASSDAAPDQASPDASDPGSGRSPGDRESGK